MRRRLAAFAASFSIACFIAQYAIPPGWHLPVALILFAVSGFTVFADKKYKFGVYLITAGLAAGFLWNFTFFQLYFKPAEELHGQTVEIYAEATDYSVSTQYGIKADAKIKTEEQGKKWIKALIYINDKELSLKPGDKISMTARLNLSTKINDDDGFTYFSSKGIFLLAYPESDAVIVKAQAVSFYYYPVLICHSIKEQISEIFDGDISFFIKALITGDRSDFTDYFRASLNDTGLTHVVSVSGMHLAFLVGFINVIVRKKRRAALIAIPVILIFMAVMGGTPSVVRAGIMQILVMLAPLLDRESDSPTSLSFALMLLLILNPFSAASVSLQLSFASIAGIIMYSERIYEAIDGKFNNLQNGLLLKAEKFIAASLSTTFAAMIFTLPLVCFYFKRVSLIAPVANLLTLWVISVIYTAGVVIVIVSFIYMPLGVMLSTLTVPFTKYIISIVQKLSSAPLASLNTANIYWMSWFLYAYAIIWLFILNKKSRYKTVVISAFIAGTFFFTLFFSSIEAGRAGMTITVLDVGQGQSVAVMSREYTMLVDCGGNKNNAGDIAADYIKSFNRNKIDLMVLSHYHTDHANGIEELFMRVEIERIALPNLEGEDALRSRVSALAAEHGTEVIDVSSDMIISLGDSQIFLYKCDDKIATNENGIVVMCKLNNFEALITGDINSLSEKRLIKRTEFPDIELLVVGHHGSKYSTSDELLEELRPEAAIISVGRNNYGHPAQSTLSRIYERGIAVYETNEQGMITVRAGK